MMRTRSLYSKPTTHRIEGRSDMLQEVSDELAAIDRRLTALESVHGPARDERAIERAKERMVDLTMAKTALVAGIY